MIYKTFFSRNSKLPSCLHVTKLTFFNRWILKWALSESVLFKKFVLVLFILQDHEFISFFFSFTIQSSKGYLCFILFFCKVLHFWDCHLEDCTLLILFSVVSALIIFQESFWHFCPLSRSGLSFPLPSSMHCVAIFPTPASLFSSLQRVCRG